MEIGGSEHLLIRIKGESERIFKTTFDDNLGCTSDFYPSDPELSGRHFHATGNADPFFYLSRWIFLNAISHYQTRYEGILPPTIASHLPRICVSQPILPRRNPTVQEIEQSLQIYRFRKISEDAFLRDADEILLTDVAPRNIRIVDGVPAPFDAIAQRAPPKVLIWAKLAHD
jgi:hypothetical protein